MNIHNQTIFLLSRFAFIVLVVSLSVGLSWSLQAEESLQDLAEAGDAAVQFELGRYYGDKAQSLEDFQKAYLWTRKAAEQGMGKAQFFVADMYCSGSGVGQSYIYAYAWHLLAAQNGIEEAEEKMEILEQLFLTPDDIQSALQIVDELKRETKNR